jgi:hypothetical protein
VNLHLLRSTPTLAIYYDSYNDWLFADWQGALTLAAVQAACLDLTQCLLQRPYAHVLNSNAQVTTVEWEVAGWLAQEFLPALTPAGVARLAWVCSPSLRGRNMVHTILSQRPLLRLSIFDELDEAVDWLRHNRTEYVSGCGLPRRPAADQAHLEQAAQALARSLRHQAAPALRAA